jgi:hypothetical protein
MSILLILMCVFFFFSFLLTEMLSRLSGFANVVLHELSGDSTDQNTTAPLAPVSSSILI